MCVCVCASFNRLSGLAMKVVVMIMMNDDDLPGLFVESLGIRAKRREYKEPESMQMEQAHG